MTMRKADTKSRSSASLPDPADLPAKKTKRSKKTVAAPPGFGECIPSTVSRREKTALLAYSYWEQRGRQGGSPEEDWYRAEREIDLGFTG